MAFVRQGEPAGVWRLKQLSLVALASLFILGFHLLAASQQASTHPRLLLAQTQRRLARHAGPGCPGGRAFVPAEIARASAGERVLVTVSPM